MRLFQHPPAQSLSEWLDLATRDLVPSAQTRIRTEIEAHYNEAVQSRLVSGSPDDAAQAAALADLGSAKSAARRFRREYLTTTNAKEAAGYLKSPMTTMLVFLVATHSSYSERLRNFDDPRIQICAAIQFLLFLVVIANIIAVFILRKQEITLTTLRKIILVYALQWLTVAPMWLLHDFEGFTDPWRDIPAEYAGTILMPFTAAAMIAAGVYLSRHFLRLRQKLLSAGDGDLPSSNSATA